MSQQPKGHVQALFEKREGCTLADWLTQHGAATTITTAAKFIGYVATPALREFVDRYMPEDFKFQHRDPLFSKAEIAAAVGRNDAGEPWRDIALEYRRDVGLLKGVCRKHKRLVREAQ